jgi:Lhr-like helicase
MKRAIDLKIKNQGYKIDSELIPLVTPETVFDKNGNELKNHKVIFNSERVDIASQKMTYQVVQHRNVIDQLQNDPEFTQKYRIDTATVYKSGCVLMLEVVPLQQNEVEIVPGDNIAPSVRIYNSYDTTKALIVESFGMRLICKNGAVAPGGVDRFHKAHTHQNADITQLKQAIEKAMATWDVSANTLRKAYTKYVDVEDTIKLLKNFPEKYKKIVIQNLRRNDTLYNVWNALTNCITFEVNVSTSTLISYQNMVNKIFKVLTEDEITESTPLPETQNPVTQQPEPEPEPEPEKDKKPWSSERIDDELGE